MKKLALGILGSGKGSNGRAILEQTSSGALAADVRVVVSDVFNAGILEIAHEFGIPNVYLPPGRFRTRLEPNVEMELVRLLQQARFRAGLSIFIRRCYRSFLASNRGSKRWRPVKRSPVVQCIMSTLALTAATSSRNEKCQSCLAIRPNHCTLVFKSPNGRFIQK